MKAGAPHEPIKGSRMNRDQINPEGSDTFPGGTSDACRPFLQVWFRCAAAYQRVYRNRQGTGYSARCPKCGRAVNFRVGPGGTEQRTFEVNC